MKAWRIYGDEWIAGAYAPTRGKARALVAEAYFWDFEESFGVRILRAPEADGRRDEPCIVDDRVGLEAMGWKVVGDYDEFGPIYKWGPSLARETFQKRGKDE